MANPTVPYVVSGKVYDRDRTTAISGATINIINKTWETDEGSINRISDVTNANGNYTVDLANLTNGYRDEDIIYIQVKYSSYSKSTIISFKVDTGGSLVEEIDIYLTNETFKFGILDSGTSFVLLRHRKITVGTTNTIGFQPVDLSRYRDVSLEINNDSGATITAKVYVTDEELPGRCDHEIDNSFWAQSGSSQTASANSSTHVIWTERPKKTCLILTASSAISDEDVHITLHAIS